MQATKELGVTFLLVVLSLRFLFVSLLHVWLNVGFQKIGLARLVGAQTEDAVQVGFLPVT